MTLSTGNNFGGVSNGGWTVDWLLGVTGVSGCITGVGCCCGDCITGVEICGGCITDVGCCCCGGCITGCCCGGCITGVGSCGSGSKGGALCFPDDDSDIINSSSDANSSSMSSKVWVDILSWWLTVGATAWWLAVSSWPPVAVGLVDCVTSVLSKSTICCCCCCTNCTKHSPLPVVKLFIKLYCVISYCLLF